MIGSVVMLTSIKQEEKHNIVRIHRETEVDAEKVLHIATGPFAGLIVNRYGPNLSFEPNGDFNRSFVVLSSGEGKEVHEKRTLYFEMKKGVSAVVGKVAINKIFYDLISDLPGTAIGFMKLVMTTLQKGYPEIQSITIEFKVLSEEEKITDLPADSHRELEKLTPARVQELLEFAYPNGVTVEMLAKNLKCSAEEVMDHLQALKDNGVARNVLEEWIRVDVKKVEESVKAQKGSATIASPTIAIISCLFVEKQAIDSLIEDSYSIHRYKSGGDSNVYTTGRIGTHHVVATKLATIGDSRAATTSAGSITTRLLGNFQDIEHVFIVGVGGAVPNLIDASLHSRRGDVIVSASPNNYFYAHDIIRNTETDQLLGFAIRNWKPADTTIENILKNAGAELVDNWNSLTKKTVQKLKTSTRGVEWEAPPQSTDILTLPLASGQYVVFPHPENNQSGPAVHLGSVGAIAKMQDSTQDEQGKVKKLFTDRYAVRCLDGGFDTVVAAVKGSCVPSWVLVRGICDYEWGQTRSGKSWQPHAALRAATMTKCLIEKLPKDA